MEVKEFRSRLRSAESHFLQGFAEACSDEAQLINRLKLGAELFPEIREELQKVAGVMDWMFKAGPKAVGFGSRMLGGAARAVPKAMQGAAKAPGLLRDVGIGAGAGAIGAVQEHGLDPTSIAGGMASGGVAGLASNALYRAGGGSGRLGAVASGLGSAAGGYTGSGSGARMGQNVKGMVDRSLGLGKPGSFSAQWGLAGPRNPDMSGLESAQTPAQLQGAFERGISGMDDQAKTWGPDYAPTFDAQRSQFFDQTRAAGKRLNVPGDAINNDIVANTPRIGDALQDAGGTYQRLQNPDIRAAFEQVELPQYETNLLNAFQSGQPIEPQMVEQVLQARALSTAAAQGVDPQELLANAQTTVQKLMSDGQLDPMELNTLIQTPGGTELATQIATSNPGMRQGLPQTLMQYFTQNPVQAGLLLLGVPLALGGLLSTFSGGGMGSIMALLAGGGMAAYGAGLFGGDGPSLIDMFNARDMGSAPFAGKPQQQAVPFAQGGAQGGAQGAPTGQPQPQTPFPLPTGPGRYAELAANPQAAIMELPENLRGYVDPQMISDWMTAYKANPAAAVNQLVQAGVPVGVVQDLVGKLGDPNAAMPAAPPAAPPATPVAAGAAAQAAAPRPSGRGMLDTIGAVANIDMGEALNVLTDRLRRMTNATPEAAQQVLTELGIPPQAQAQLLQAYAARQARR